MFTPDQFNTLTTPVSCIVDGTVFYLTREQLNDRIQMTLEAHHNGVPLYCFAQNEASVAGTHWHPTRLAAEANYMLHKLIPRCLEARKQIALAMA